MMSARTHNHRRAAVEKAQREARKRDNEIGTEMLQRLFPSLRGPQWSRILPPESNPNDKE